MIRMWALLLALILPGLGHAVECATIEHAGNTYSVCTVDARSADMRLFLRDQDGRTLGQFTTIDRQLQDRGETLVFAMNAGMYHDDRSPVGLYVEDGDQIMHLVPGAGPGNFGLVPNGVYCIRQSRTDVIETSRFQRAPPDCTYATQSGPMLVIDGVLHPRFLKDGTSKFIRNGVGTTADGTTSVFVISDNPVNFHAFGSFFRDVLRLPNALYFDGKVSRLYAPDFGRSDLGFALGPIVGVVAPQD